MLYSPKYFKFVMVWGVYVHIKIHQGNFFFKDSKIQPECNTEHFKPFLNNKNDCVVGFKFKRSGVELAVMVYLWKKNRRLWWSWNPSAKAQHIIGSNFFHMYQQKQPLLPQEMKASLFCHIFYFVYNSKLFTIFLGFGPKHVRIEGRCVVSLDPRLDF